jgi:hypothetical protein
MMWRAQVVDVVLAISVALTAALARRQTPRLEVVHKERCAIVPIDQVLHVPLATVLNVQVVDIARAISAAMVASLAHQQSLHSQVVLSQRARIAPVARFLLLESLSEEKREIVLW